jgi:hypothetical protein
LSHIVGDSLNPVQEEQRPLQAREPLMASLLHDGLWHLWRLDDFWILRGCFVSTATCILHRASAWWTPSSSSPRSSEPSSSWLMRQLCTLSSHAPCLSSLFGMGDASDTLTGLGLTMTEPSSGLPQWSVLFDLGLVPQGQVAALAVDDVCCHAHRSRGNRPRGIAW